MIKSLLEPDNLLDTHGIAYTTHIVFCFLSDVFQWGWLVSALEWCVFVCNHSARGEQWKSSFASSPPFIQVIMANGFRTPVGVWVVSGLHGLPVWLFACRAGLLPPLVQPVGTMVLAAGRLLALFAEVETSNRNTQRHTWSIIYYSSCSICVSVQIWCVWTHIKYLINDDLPQEKTRWTSPHWNNLRHLYSSGGGICFSPKLNQKMKTSFLFYSCKQCICIPDITSHIRCLFCVRLLRTYPMGASSCDTVLI